MENIDTENLLRVLGRVAPASPEPEEPRAPAALRRAIEGVSAAGDVYGLLAMKARGRPAGDVLRALSREERESERRLQAEFFLLTGDTCPTLPRHPSAPYFLRALRERYLMEERSAKELDDAAKGLPGSTGELLREVAKVERSHAARLRELISATLY